MHSRRCPSALSARVDRPGDRVLDLFAGSGTTGAVASALGRDAVLVDSSPEAVRVMRARIPHASVPAV